MKPMTPQFSRRDFLKLGGAALLTAAFGHLKLSGAEATTPPVIYHGSRLYPRIAMTYDDCYLVTRLHMLQGSLDDNPSVRVTLFPVGEALLNNEDKEPGIWTWFFSRGHEFGYHSFSHINPGVVSTENELEDYDKWQAALYQVLGAKPPVRFARPPFGNLSPSFLNMCSARGLVATMWSTGFGGPVEIGVHAAERAQNGDIVLMHLREQPAIPSINQEESRDMTITAKVLPYFTERGIECVTLSQLYDDLLRDENNSYGCDTGTGESLTRTCLDQ
jgi:peptidoglycan/xylan/chitin deacetylase (PgdA/CDA1 family)